MRVELVQIDPQHTGTAAVDVAFLLPGCKRAREVRFFVRMHGDVVVNEAAPIPLSIPKRIREQLGAAGWELIRAEASRLFIEHCGPARIARCVAKHEAQEHQRRINQATASLRLAASQLLRLGLECSAIEEMVREAAVEKVMRS
jgi:hypothetical protein